MFKELKKANKWFLYLSLLLTLLTQGLIVLIPQTTGIIVNNLVSYLRGATEFKIRNFAFSSALLLIFLLSAFLLNFLARYIIKLLSLQLVKKLFVEYLKILEGYSTAQRLTRFNFTHLFSVFQSPITSYVEKGVNSFFALFNSFSLFVFVFASFLYNHWSLLVVALIDVGLLTLCTVLSGRLYKGKYEEYAAKSQMFLKTLNEVLKNFSLLYFTNRTQKFSKIIANSSKQEIESEVKIFKINNLVAILVVFTKLILEFISILIVIWLLFQRIFEAISVATVIVFWDLLPRTMQQISGISTNFLTLKAVQPLKKQFTLPNFIVNKRQDYKINEVTTIQFKDWTFGYQKNKYLFQNFNLSFKGGRIYGIMGPSGCGKSTLIKTLLGLNKEYIGSITINGMEVKKLADNFFRENVAYCGPEIFVFDTTIKNNITIFEDHQNTNEVQKIIHLENLDPELEALHLSSGQKQRIVLARTIFENKSILIFDESFTNLDRVTLKRIQKNLLTWKKNRTIIIVSHHISQKENFFDEVFDFTVK